jgi:F0F1-type ATP synthase membrane subunit b/b'
MGPELLPNITFFYELGLFFVCYFVLKFLVFKPYFELQQMRLAKTVGLKEQAARDRERADKLKSDYDIFIKGERKKLNVWVEDERKKIAEEERKLVQQTRESVSEEMKSIRQTLKDETDKARKELLPMVAEYSSQIATKLVGRSVKVSASAVEHSSRPTAETSVPG